MPTDKPGGSIVISDDFVGLKDADGNVIVDDTAYFRQREIERPIWDALESSERMRELRRRADAARQALEADGGDALQTLCLVQHWIEQYIVGTCALMLEEAKKNA